MYFKEKEIYNLGEGVQGERCKLRDADKELESCLEEIETIKGNKQQIMFFTLLIPEPVIPG